MEICATAKHVAPQPLLHHLLFFTAGLMELSTTEFCVLLPALLLGLAIGIWLAAGLAQEGRYADPAPGSMCLPPFRSYRYIFPASIKSIQIPDYRAALVVERLDGERIRIADGYAYPSRPLPDVSLESNSPCSFAATTASSTLIPVASTMSSIGVRGRMPPLPLRSR